MDNVKFDVVFVDTIEEDIQPNTLYISEKYKCAIHLCACGCKGKTITPLQNITGGWNLQKHEDGTVSLTPSIGNWIGENPYHAHYFITRSEAVFC